jgi:hypothetical protein
MFLRKDSFAAEGEWKIGITNEQIAILKGVASVETGGQVQSIRGIAQL